MKLYFSPGACSLSPHIALIESGLPFEVERVSLSKKKTASGADFFAVNPKGSVPALVLDDGQILTEGPAIVQYIADQRPASKLAPANGTFERYRLQEWLNFISSEIHKAFGPLFDAKTPDETKVTFRGKLTKRFDFLETHLAGKQYLMGDAFTVADGYLYTVLRWTKLVGLELADWPSLAAYAERVGARPAVKAALATEEKRT